MSDEIALASAARLLGRLAVAEIDEELAEELWEPERRDALGQLGLELPDRESDDLDRLAREFNATFAGSPGQLPLVQSICEEGRDSGRAAEEVRQLVGRLGIELDSPEARESHPDQLGAALLLWAELVDEPTLAREFAARHLRWALPHLERLFTAEGFYGRLAWVIAQFIEVVSQR